jgi:hypothetical protein
MGKAGTVKRKGYQNISSNRRVVPGTGDLDIAEGLTERAGLIPSPFFIAYK